MRVFGPSPAGWHQCRLTCHHFFNIVMYMPRGDFLGGFELLVLLALLRLGEEAYGVPIAEAIEESSGREVALGSVYVTLGRLEDKGLVTSRIGEPTAVRGGRARTYFTITAAGLRAVRHAQRTLTTLWSGIPLKGATR
jgi:PadR family transcriptional regulator PadR